MPKAKLLAGIGLLGMVVLLEACSKSKNPQPEVIILHSGRIRGNVYPLALQSISPLQYYQYLAGYIKKVREEAARSGAKVFVVDLGDSLEGSFAAHVTSGANMVAFFNEAGYDAVQLSNLDAEISSTTLKGLKAKILDPFELASGESAIAGTSTSARFELGDLSIFFLANFYGDTDSTLHPERFPASLTARGARPVRDYKQTLEKLGVNGKGSLTLFGWMKFEREEAIPEIFLQQLRGLGVDAILAHRVYGSHEREAWEASGFVDWRPPVSLNILRNNGGFVLARMDLARSDDGWRVLSHRLLPMTANNAPSDTKVVAEIEKFTDQIKAADTQLIELKQPVSEARVLDIYMAAMAAIPGTQAVAYSPESIRSDWQTGNLRASEVFNSLPWTTGLVQMRLTADQFAKVIESRLLRVAVAKPIPENALVLTTSRFFGQLIARRFDIAAEEITALPQNSEFDFFLSYLKNHPDAPGLGKTWTIYEPQ